MLVVVAAVETLQLTSCQGKAFEVEDASLLASRSSKPYGKFTGHNGYSVHKYSSMVDHGRFHGGKGYNYDSDKHAKNHAYSTAEDEHHDHSQMSEYDVGDYGKIADYTYTQNDEHKYHDYFKKGKHNEDYGKRDGHAYAKTKIDKHYYGESKPGADSFSLGKPRDYYREVKVDGDHFDMSGHRHHHHHQHYPLSPTTITTTTHFHERAKCFEAFLKNDCLAVHVNSESIYSGAHAFVKVTSASVQVTVSWGITGLSMSNAVIGMHLHEGNFTTNGPILVGFCGQGPLPAFGGPCKQGPRVIDYTLMGQACNVGKSPPCPNSYTDNTIKEAAAKIMGSEDPLRHFYLNIHTDFSFEKTAKFEMGALGLIRGQLVPRHCRVD